MRWLLALALICGAPGAALAQAAPAGYVLPDTETWQLEGPDGYPYQIYVSKPQGEAPAGGYPVLYVLDGNAMFAGFAEARRILGYTKSDVGKTIVVAIGYKTEQAYDVRRIYDFTPDHLQPVPPGQQYLEQYKAGGHEVFAGFIMDRLRPEIARRYTVNAARQSLYGHSLGGLFALHMLYSRPTEWHAIVSASPSIWWNDQAILKEERAFADKLARGELGGVPARLRVVGGELDETMVELTDAPALAERLKALSAYGLRSELEVFKGETHITVPSRSVTSTLRFVASWP